MADEREERWGLVVTVPPVVDEVRVVEVRCGNTTAQVKEYTTEERDRWAVYQGDWPAIGGGEGWTLDRALRAARSLVLKQERGRLLEISLAEALKAEGESPDAADVADRLAAEGTGEVSRG